MVCGRIHAGGQDLKNDRRSVKRKRGGMVPGERYRLLLFTRNWDRFQVTAWAIENHALSCGCQVCQNKKT